MTRRTNNHAMMSPQPARLLLVLHALLLLAATCLPSLTVAFAPSNTCKLQPTQTRPSVLRESSSDSGASTTTTTTTTATRPRQFPYTKEDLGTSMAPWSAPDKSKSAWDRQQRPAAVGELPRSVAPRPNALSTRGQHGPVSADSTKRLSPMLSSSPITPFYTPTYSKWTDILKQPSGSDWQVQKRQQNGSAARTTSTATSFNTRTRIPFGSWAGSTSSSTNAAGSGVYSKTYQGRREDPNPGNYGNNPWWRFAPSVSLGEDSTKRPPVIPNTFGPPRYNHGGVYGGGGSGAYGVNFNSGSRSHSRRLDSYANGLKYEPFENFEDDRTSLTGIGRAFPSSSSSPYDSPFFDPSYSSNSYRASSANFASSVAGSRSRSPYGININNNNNNDISGSGPLIYQNGGWNSGGNGGSAGTTRRRYSPQQPTQQQQPSKPWDDDFRQWKDQPGPPQARANDNNINVDPRRQQEGYEYNSEYFDDENDQYFPQPQQQPLDWSQGPPSPPQQRRQEQPGGPPPQQQQPPTREEYGVRSGTSAPLSTSLLDTKNTDMPQPANPEPRDGRPRFLETAVHDPRMEARDQQGVSLPPPGIRAPPSQDRNYQNQPSQQQQHQQQPWNNRYDEGRSPTRSNTPHTGTMLGPRQYSPRPANGAGRRDDTRAPRMQAPSQKYAYSSPRSSNNYSNNGVGRRDDTRPPSSRMNTAGPPPGIRAPPTMDNTSRLPSRDRQYQSPPSRRMSGPPPPGVRAPDYGQGRTTYNRDDLVRSSSSSSPQDRQYPWDMNGKPRSPQPPRSPSSSSGPWNNDRMYDSPQNLARPSSGPRAPTAGQRGSNRPPSEHRHPAGGRREAPWAPSNNSNSMPPPQQQQQQQAQGGGGWQEMDPGQLRRVAEQLLSENRGLQKDNEVLRHQQELIDERLRNLEGGR